MSYPCRMTDPFLPTYDFDDIPTDEEVALDKFNKILADVPATPIWPFPVTIPVKPFLPCDVALLKGELGTINAGYVMLIHPDQAVDLAAKSCLSGKLKPVMKPNDDGNNRIDWDATEKAEELRAFVNDALYTPEELMDMRSVDGQGYNLPSGRFVSNADVRRALAVGEDK